MNAASLLCLFGLSRLPLLAFSILVAFLIEFEMFCYEILFDTNGFGFFVLQELVTLSSHPLLIPPDISNAGRHLSAVEFHSLLQSASLFVALSPFSNHVWLFSKLLDEESPTDDDNQIEEAVYVCELCQKHSRSVGSLPSTEDGKIEFASTQFELKTVNSDPSISLQPTWRHGSEYPRKRRILCLHRFRQNASSFKGRNASLAKKLKNILSLFLSMRPMSCHSFINLLMHYLCCKVVHHHNQRTVERTEKREEERQKRRAKLFKSKMDLQRKIRAKLDKADKSMQANDIKATERHLKAAESIRDQLEDILL
ncbi:hypothetical protein QYF36_013084 [Acer negundo]|nr:hypothetical protein QYF36_013084 [Acer negundo]